MKMTTINQYFPVPVSKAKLLLVQSDLIFLTSKVYDKLVEYVGKRIGDIFEIHNLNSHDKFQLNIHDHQIVMYEFNNQARGKYEYKIMINNLPYDIEFYLNLQTVEK